MFLLFNSNKMFLLFNHGLDKRNVQKNVSNIYLILADILILDFNTI